MKGEGSPKVNQMEKQNAMVNLWGKFEISSYKAESQNYVYNMFQKHFHL